jgi:protein-disulfide isomerase-like protein with CxxC motif
MSRDPIDVLVIEELAASEAALSDCVATLTADRASFRELALEAMHALQEAHSQAGRDKATIQRLRDELRRYVAAAIQQNGRAA